MTKLVLTAALAMLLVAGAGSASAAPSTRSIARLVEHRTAARFVSQVQARVSATCWRRSTRRFKCHFAITSGEDLFRGRVRVRVLHSGRIKLRWGELHLGGFEPAACASHPAFTVSSTDVPGVGTIPGTTVPAESCAG